MKKALIVARWEFFATITRRAYIFAVVALPLFYVVLGGIGNVAGRATASTANRLPLAIVDHAGIVDVGFAAAQDDLPPTAATPPPDAITAAGPPSPTPAAAPPSIVLYEDVNRALDALSNRQVAAVFVVDADYLATGTLAEYSRDSGFFSLQTERQRQTRVGDAIRASLMKPALSGDAFTRAYTPVRRVNRHVMNTQGTIQPNDDAAGLGSFGVFYVLLMSIFFSAGFLQQATGEDRQTRMLEILLSSLDCDELLVGKLMGLGAAGLLQVAIYGLLILVPGATLFVAFKISIARVLLSLVYFAIAYLMFACLMTGTGVLGRSAQESAQLSVLWTVAAATPLFFGRAIGTAPNGVVARVLSFFPLTSPTTMMLRLTTADVPAIDIVASIALGVVSIYAVQRASSRIFRAASLMYGKRPTLPELVRWLRAAST